MLMTMGTMACAHAGAGASAREVGLRCVHGWMRLGLTMMTKYVQMRSTLRAGMWGGRRSARQPSRAHEQPPAPIHPLAPTHVMTMLNPSFHNWEL